MSNWFKIIPHSLLCKFQIAFRTQSDKIQIRAAAETEAPEGARLFPDRADSAPVTREMARAMGLPRRLNA